MPSSIPDGSGRGVDPFIHILQVAGVSQTVGDGFGIQVLNLGRPGILHGDPVGNEFQHRDAPVGEDT